MFIKFSSFNIINFTPEQELNITIMQLNFIFAVIFIVDDYFI